MQGETHSHARMLEVLPLQLASKLVQLQWRVVVLPWNLFLYWLSCLAGGLVRFLVFAGAPPAEYANKSKLRELLGVVEHMHQREDQYRRKIKELQEESEVRYRDKKKALAKLAKARADLGVLQAQLEGAGMGGEAGPSGSGSGAPRLGVHASVAAATLAALWFFKHDHFPAVSRKIVSSVVCPLWFFWVWALSRSAPRAFAAGLPLASWFLLGFVFCHWVTNT